MDCENQVALRERLSTVASIGLLDPGGCTKGANTHAGISYLFPSIPPNQAKIFESEHHRHERDAVIVGDPTNVPYVDVASFLISVLKTSAHTFPRHEEVLGKRVRETLVLGSALHGRSVVDAAAIAIEQEMSILMSDGPPSARRWVLAIYENAVSEILDEGVEAGKLRVQAVDKDVDAALI